MTDQLILAVVALLLVLVLLFEAEETWRWRGSENRPESRFRIVRLFRRVVGGVLAIFTLRRSSGRHTSKSDPAAMASEDVARRLGTADAAAGPVHIAPQRIVVSGPHRVEAPPPVVPLAVPPLAVERSSRLRLLRDTVGATLVLIGFVVVAINVVIPPQSQNPQPSGGVLDATATPRIETPASTQAPAESAVAIASTVPEPSPTQTILVSSTPSPTPTDRPTRTRAPQTAPPPPPPTTAPTSTPTPKPTKKPPTPTPTPKAPVIGTFSADQGSLPVDGGTVTFSISVSNPVNAHYQIDFDDAGQTGAGAVPSDGTFTVTHSYAAGPYAGAINPVLTVTGPGGQDTKPTSINVQ